MEDKVNLAEKLGAFNEHWAPERPVRLGEVMGNRPT